MKKKLFCCFVIFILCLVLAGCGQSKNEKEEQIAGKCTILVECSTIFDNMDQLDSQLKDYIPESGTILEKRSVEFFEDESVYDILERELKKDNILMEVSFTGKSVYVEGIDNIYEFSCGDLSGWMYCVNGKYPNVSCSDYKVKDSDVIEWHYTCDLGKDLEQ